MSGNMITCVSLGFNMVEYKNIKRCNRNLEAINGSKFIKNRIILSNIKMRTVIMYSEEQIRQYIREKELQDILKEIEPFIEKKTKAEDMKLKEKLNRVLYWTISDTSYDRKTQFELISQLIAAGAELNCSIKIRFERNPDTYQWKDEYESTPLLATLRPSVSQNGTQTADTELLEFLVKNGADINYYSSGKNKVSSWKNIGEHILYHVSLEAKHYGHYIKYLLENPHFKLDKDIVGSVFDDLIRKEQKRIEDADIYDTDETSEQSYACYIDLFVDKFIRNPELVSERINESLIKYFRTVLRKNLATYQGKSKNEDLIRNFSKLNIDINSKDRYETTLLHELCYDGNVAEVRELFNLGAVLNESEGNKRTPFQNAFNRNKFEIVDLILMKGGKLNEEDRTAIVESVYSIFSNKSLLISERLEQIKPYLKYFPLIKMKSTSEVKAAKEFDINTILDLGLGTSSDFSKIVKDPTVGSVLLNTACRTGDVELVSELINLGAKDDPTLGDYALHTAVTSKNIKLIQLLLANKADANQQNQEGQTPLHIAAAITDPEIIKILLNAGASYSALDKKGKTPLVPAFGNPSLSSYSSTDPEIYRNFIKEILILRQLGQTMLRWSLDSHVTAGPHEFALSTVPEDILKKSFLDLFHNFSKVHFELIKKGICQQFNVSDDEIQSIIKQIYELISKTDPKESSSWFSSSILGISNSQVSPFALEYGTDFGDGSHHEALVVVEDPDNNFMELYRCNRGAGSHHRTGVEVNKVKNTLQLSNLSGFVYDSSRGKYPDSATFNKELEKKLGLERTTVLKMLDQRVGNCRWMTRKTMLYAAMYGVLKLFFIKKGQTPAKSHELAYNAAKAWYKPMTVQDRFDHVQQLLNLLPDQPVVSMNPVIKHALLSIYIRSAKKEKYKPVLDLLMDRGVVDLYTTYYLLSESINRQQVMLAKMAIQKGADPNFPHSYDSNRKPITMLMAAIDQGNAEIVDLLIKAGANVDKGDPRPLLLASAHENADLLQLLVKAGARPLTEAEKVEINYYKAERKRKIARDHEMIEQGKARALAWLASRKKPDETIMPESVADRKDSVDSKGSQELNEVNRPSDMNKSPNNSSNNP